ncbi:MAG: hypothetical protein ABL907_23550 [Hyphomicrobium sp.]
MKRPETQEKLDQMVWSDRATVLAGAATVVIAALVLMGLGYYPGSEIAKVPATVLWSELAVPHQSGEPFSKIRAALSSGKHVYLTAAHTPPPIPGERVMLRVRRNIIGWYSYSWIMGQTPALTDGPGKL